MEKRKNILRIILSAATVFIVVAVAGTAAAYAPASAKERGTISTTNIQESSTQKIVENLITMPSTLSTTAPATVTPTEKSVMSSSEPIEVEVEEEEVFIEEELVEDEYVEEEKETIEEDYAENDLDYSIGDYSPSDLEFSGRLYWGGWSWTWYSERVLPGEGLSIPGRYTDENGFVCDENGYICLASGSLSKGTVVDTPFGRSGKVYDCGCAADVLDVYVNW